MITFFNNTAQENGGAIYTENIYSFNIFTNSLNMMLNTALNGGCIYFTTTTTPINIVSNFFIFIENSAR